MSKKPIKIAILAMGGEGGGVLADWIVDLGENNGYIAQTTSVPGVAQRTGATIYYVELFSEEQAKKDGGKPVLALMPLPGDVDIVIASELMEAGRAVQRGLVTPDRTTLIASTHRVYAIVEKIAMGDGRVDSNELIAHAATNAKHFVRFDMEQAAQKAGSVISAVLFGTLAGSGVLPFNRAQFESTIERGGVGVKPSLRAFAMGYARATGDVADNETLPHPAKPLEHKATDPKVIALLDRVKTKFPEDAHYLIVEGVRRLIDYQDPEYAGLYLDRLEKIRALPDDNDGKLLRETARHLALWMSWEDTIRVAELKVRKKRFERVRGEVGVQDGQQLNINEFMHPRLEEIAETMPAGIGRWLLKPGIAHNVLGYFTQAGRVVQTSSLGGYMLLWFLSRFRAIRRKTLRYEMETPRIEQWLAYIAKTAAINPSLALEVAMCQRLVKGYSDTHARGLKNYLTLMGIVENQGSKLAPATLRDLRDAALADEHGKKLKVVMGKYSLA